MTRLESTYLLDPPGALKEERRNDSVFSKACADQGVGGFTLVDATNGEKMSHERKKNQPSKSGGSADVCPECNYPMIWQKALLTGELYLKCTNPNPVKGAVAGICPCGKPLVWRNSNLTGELYPGCTNYAGGCRFNDRSH